MHLEELLAELTSREIELQKSGNDLVAVGNRERLTEGLIVALRTHKAALLDLVPQATPVTITPEMLPLVRLTAEQIAHIVSTVPGGAANVQDIYPLAPLQDGILFHVLLGGESDPYLIASLYAFESRRQMDAYLAALRTVIERHDILRTAVLWENLPEPVQVVWRRAPLSVEEVVLDQTDGDLATQLYARFDPRRHRVDVRQAPMLKIATAWDSAQERWLLLRRVHHLVSDHQTLEMIEEEIERCLLGEEATLPAPLPFRNIVAHARMAISPSEHEAYFRALLDGVDGPTAPFGLMNVRHDGTDVDVGRERVDADVGRRLRAAARTLGVAAASIFHVAWAQVLMRMAGRDDVVFGTTLFGRLHGAPGAQRVLGPSMNTLPVRLRADTHGAASAVRSMHAQLAALLRHEHAPLALAQRCSAVPAPLPLFSSLLNYRHDPPRRARPSTGIRGLHGEARSNYPLAFAVDDRGDGFRLTAQVTGAVPAGRVCGYMHAAVASLVEALEQAPTRSLRTLEVLPRSEVLEILEVGNAAREVPSTRALPLSAIFERQVQLTPDAPAVVSEEATVTYRVLNRRANQVAHQLRALGVRPDARVALCAERGIEVIVGVLAVLKAGGSYVPLDPTYPEARLRGMLADSAPLVVLADEHTRARCSALAASIPMLDLTDDGCWRGQPTSDPHSAAVGLMAEHLAYVIYTSGSTGTPKGVMVSHRSVAAYVTAIGARVGFSAGFRCGWVSTVAADLGYTMLFPALLRGGVLHVISTHVSTDAEKFAAYTRAHALEYLKITPSHFDALVADERAAEAIPAEGLVFGGEVLTASLVARVRALRPGCRVYNHYGPTECTVGAVSTELDGDGAATNGRMPLGRALGHGHVLLLDEASRIVPAHVDAEICIGGEGVARGYLRRPEWTAARFVPDPFGAPGARLYRTGDVGRWRADGMLDFLGRVDRQVKIRGHRIELEEIEAQLRALPSVRDAVAMISDESDADPRLVAYVVPEAEAAAPLLAALRLAKHGGVLPTRYELPNGMLVSYQSQAEADYLYREIFEQQTYLQHGLTLPPDACVFDVGANIGLFTLFALDRAPDARVYAFEPIPAVYENLRLNADLAGGRVRVFDCGLAASAGTASFAWFRHNSLLSGRHVDVAADTHTILAQVRYEGRSEGLGEAALQQVIADRLRYEAVTCSLRTLSEVIASEGVERIDLLKIDAQRSELEILEGLAEGDWAKIEQVVLEVHDIEGRLALIQRAMTLHGFHVEVAQDPGLAGTEHHTVYARRRATAPVACDTIPAPPRKYWTASQLSAALIAELSAVLPEHMVPAVYVPLDRLPLNANGKIDRRALPAPEAEASPTPEYDAPLGDVEATVARVWTEVLQRERVGRHDNFFALGGHSLLAVRVIARLRQAGIQIDIGALFTRPTVAALAAGIEPERQRLDIPSNGIAEGCEAITPAMLPLVTLTEEEIARIVVEVPGGAANVQDIYPLAPLQEGILFHALLSGEGDPYLLGSLYSFESRQRLDAYLRALQIVIARHDILRSAVIWEGVSEPVQLVWRSAPLLTEEAVFDAQAGDVATQLHARYDPRHFRLDMHRAPLLKAVIARDETNDRWLLMQLLHHLVGDHVTLDVMHEEIEACLSGEEARLPTPMPFRTLVAQARLGISESEHERYFQQLLGDVAEPTAPFGLLNVRGDGTGIEEARIQVEDGVAERLRRQAGRLGVSVASLMHVAWAQVLARIAAREDVVFGTVLFGRMGGESERVLGLLINTLPVRVRIGDVSAVDAARRVHEQLAETLRHEHAPLALAQRCSAVAAPAPLFSSLLNYRHSTRRGRRKSAWAGIRRLRGDARTSYPLMFAVDDFGDGFQLIAQVERPVGAERVCGYMHLALTSLVEALEQRPHVRARVLEVLPAAERNQLLEAGRVGQEGHPAGECLAALFERSAALTPDASAVVCDETSVTYGALNQRANQVAHALRALGVGPDVRVALCAERSVDLIVGLVAVLKAGGAYVPLDPAYPDARLRGMLLDSAPVAVLADAQTRARCEAVAAGPVLDLTEASRWGGQPTHDPDRGARGLTPAHLAYVIYTSGSTGTPKGVMVSQAAVTQYVAAIQATLGLGPGGRCGWVSTVAADLGHTMLFPALLGGGVLHVVPTAVSTDADRFAAYRRAHQIEYLKITPSHFHALLGDGPARDAIPTRGLVFGGEVVSPALVASIAAQRPACQIYNHYGPTECTVGALADRVTVSAAASAVVPLGRPLGAAGVTIVDASGQLVPVGVAGEICIGGGGVARGYLRRADVTAERFVPDPFAGGGARLYRTGDRGRWRADGRVEFLGRADRQVKVRGYRIELAEIEAQLRAHTAVRDVVVMARDEAAGDRRLVAYYTSGEDTAAEVTTDALRAHLLAVLPAYMVPAAYVRLAAFPVTANGKVDLQALPAPEGGGPAEAYEAPVGEVEETLARVWAEVLKRERVSRRDNFFALGGHSLLAMRVIARLRHRLPVAITIGDLFTHPVLADLAQVIATATPLDVPAIPRVDRARPLPLSFAQQRLWFVAQLEGVSHAYHIDRHVAFRGALDVAALQRALDRIVARHEVLRTTMVVVDGQPMQRIGAADASAFSLAVEDWRGRGEAGLARAIREEVGAPFHLNTGPLIRGRLFHRRHDRQLLVITMHHIVTDGWSMELFETELRALYAAFVRGDADPLPPLPVQYADYALWQREWLTGAIVDTQADYWRRTLAGVPTLLTLPTDRPRPEKQDYTGGWVRIALDESRTRALRAASRRRETTLFMTLLAAWAALMARLSGQTDVVIGTPVANRGRVEIEGLIGFFVNMLPVRLDLSGSPSVEAWLARVKDRLLASQQQQDLPFEQMVELVRPVRSMAHHPLFQVVFTWQAAGERAMLAEAAVPSGPVRQVLAKYDLHLTLREAGDRIVGGVRYATALFDQATVERYVGYLHRLLDGLVADTAQPIDRIAILSGAERPNLLEAGHVGQEGHPAGECLAALFERSAALTPDASAVVCDETSVTYGALNQRANQVAHALRALGVGPDVRVALCAERSVDLIVGLVAVLKAGGAYVPLDPAYPDARLRGMLLDSAPVAVLADAQTRARCEAVAAGPVLDLTEASRWGGQPTHDPDRGARGLTPAHLAYVIYTSGSTGTPKGVMVSQAAVTQYVAAIQATLGLGPGGRCGWVSTVAADLGHTMLFPALLGGGVLHVVPTAVSTDADRFAAYRRAHQIEYLKITPSHFHALLGDGPARDAIPTRGLVFGGEVVSPALVASIAAQRPACQIYNHYGPTECTVGALADRVTVSAAASAVVPLGRPLGAAGVTIVDASGQLVPVGVAGEICIGGGGVARGYLRRADVTAERFVPDPFAGGGARLYRTGDRGRWRADGRVEFLGRADRQVKVRGYRIELAEIEAQLRAHTAVRDVVVMARDEAAGDRRLVAYYTSGEDTAAEVTTDALRAHLLAVLPAYMVPAAYVRLAAFPVTANGKVDLQALPAPEGGGPAEAYEAPVGEVEETLARVWAEVLKRERVSRRDNFFALGGHSLLAVRVIARLRQAGLQADIGAVFAAPTLADLAAALDPAATGIAVPPNRIPASCEVITPAMLPLVSLGEEEIARVVATVPGGAANVQDIYPLAPLQEGILFHALLGGEDPYVLGSLYRVDSRARVDAYVSALQAVIARHDILRTAFVWEGLAAPVQVVWRDAVLSVEEVVLEAGTDGASALFARYAPRRQGLLDLQRAPLMRVAVAWDAAHAQWLLMQVQHHLIGDHVTTDAIRGEVDAHLRGEAAHLPAPRPFRNLVAQARLGVSEAAHEAYFRQVLGDVTEPTAPFGLLDVRAAEGDIETARVRLPAAVSARLRAQARARQVSAATLCHVAWGQVLARIAGRADVVYGTVLFGRLQGDEGAEQAFGLFMNTLPVRLRLEGQGAAEAVRAMHVQLAETLQHEHAPLALAQRCSGVPAPTPLFSSLLNYRYGRQVETSAPRGEGMRQIRGAARTNFPVVLSVDDFGEDFRLTAQVQGPVTASRVVAYMETALTALVAALESAPERPVAGLEVLPEPERQQVLAAWNATAAAYPDTACLPALVEAVAHATPDAVAAVCDEASLTYAALNRQANQVAHALRAQGVTSGVRVAVAVARGLDLLVAVLAVWKSGGVYVPLDPTYPQARLQDMLEDSAPAVLVTSGESPVGAGARWPVLDLQRRAAWQVQPATDLAWPARRSSRELAYIIYTSGSTGRPKGAMVEHRGMVNHLYTKVRDLGLRADDRVAQTASPSFDISVWQCLAPLVVGGTTVIVSDRDVRDPAALAATLARAGVTVFETVPIMLEALTDREAAGALPSLRWALVTGEACASPLCRRWLAQHPAIPLVNAYGPTECSDDVTHHVMAEPPAATLPVAPIGRPVANTRLYVLNAARAPVPAGVAGELYVGGDGVGRGYWQRAAVTAERFVPDGCGPVPGARLYRTGDLARYTDDGVLEFLGRVDTQVKVRGYRIELEEIEARLRTHPAVHHVVVLAREQPDGDRRLVAYYTSHASAAAAAETEHLRAHLAATLPDYMVPVAYVRLTALPVTANGKLDRKALPAPDEAAVAASAYEPPLGEIETTVAAIWAEVLQVARVGRHDNFFALGGHSLLAVRVMARLRQAGIPVEVRALFATPTVAEVAAAIEPPQMGVVVPPNGIPDACTAITPAMLPLVALNETEIAHVVATVAGGAANVQDIYPLAPLQEGILFHALFEGSGDPYVIARLIGFKTRTQLDAYLTALRAVMARHDILRTAVVWDGLREPVQVVWRQAPLPIEEVTLNTDDTAGALYARYDPQRVHLDVRQAPLLHLVIARDPAHDRWLLMQRLHHLAGDQVTMDVLQGEIAAIQDGGGARLPAARPFRNLVAQARLGVSAAKHEAYFRELVGDVTEPTAPFGLLDVHGNGTAIDAAHLRLSPELTRRLRAHARGQGVSAASLFHVAWAQVLARVTGRADVVFGTVLFGRMALGEEGTLGLFINTLPVRLRLEGTGVVAAVRGMHAQLAELLRHEHASLALAQRCSAVPAPTPLFSSLLNYRHRLRRSAPSHGGVGPQILRSEGRTNYPVTVSIDDGEDFRLTAQVQVESTVAASRVVAYMETALASLADALELTPDRPLTVLEVLPAAERQQVLAAWNATATPYPDAQCLPALVEAVAHTTPDAVAAVCDDTQLTYAALHRRANQVAHALRGYGVTPGVRVAVGVPRGLELLVAVLAVLKSGGVYVPLDPTYPRTRLRDMLDDSAPAVLLTSGAGPVRDEAACPVLDLQARAWRAQATTDLAWPARRSSRELAYIIYTSGSTGRPKGAMVEHRGMVNHLYTKVRDLGLRADDRVAQTASPCFDISVWQFLAPLLVGGTTVIVSDHDARDPAALAATLARADVTVFETVPVLLEALTAAEGAARVVAPSLRWALVTGEACASALCRRWLEQHPTIPLVNAYGPTECSDDVTHHVMARPPAAALSVAPIGRPVANTRLYMLNAAMAPVPAGVAGELYVGGDGVGRGYWQRTALTAERFVPDRFGPTPGARLYRTGDLARYTDDGVLEFLGRVDTQVKVRGYRIELEEIEARLRTHPAVHHAVVIARDQPDGDRRLVAYYTSHDEAADDAAIASALRAHVAATLPDYMVPMAYMRLTALPVTANGKLDRRALPAPDDTAVAASAYEPPFGEIETTVAAIWAEVLQVARVGRHDNFFALGGHSLLAVRVLFRLQHQLSINVTIRDLFAHPVLADFAGELGAATPVDFPRIAPVSRDQPLLLSFAQLRLWFLAQMEGASQAYHVSFNVRLIGALDGTALRRALDEIVTRHEMLRTTFIYRDGQPLQSIASAESGFQLIEHDLRGHPDTRFEIDRLIAGEAHTPFNLTWGPLIRGRLIQYDENAHVLLVTMHHIVSDGWSMNVFMKEMSALYTAFLHGQDNPLPPLAVQYADYAAWQRQWIDGQILEQQRDYWKHTLAAAPPLLAIPTDRPRPTVLDYSGAQLTFVLSEDLSSDLRALSRRTGTTLYMTLLAAWAALLARLSGQSDLVIGTPVANRTRAELEDLIGFFVNTLALRLDLSGSPSVTEWLKRVKAQVLAAQVHQDLPFEQVVEMLAPVRSVAHAPLFQTMFTVNIADSGRVSLGDVQVRSITSPHTIAKFDISLALTDTGKEIVGRVEYATALFERPTVERYMRYFQVLVHGMVANPMQAIDHIAIVPATERQHVLDAWNDTRDLTSRETCVHELFERWVERAPDAVAVVDSDVHLTYRELNRCANRLARDLRKRGVQPDTLVAVALDRSPELVLAILGILKAGAAYLPLDRTYPVERLRQMVDDCRPRALLTRDPLEMWAEVVGAGVWVADLTTLSAWRTPAAADRDDHPQRTSPQQLAYVMHTSGSTGRPKGVMVPHAAIARVVVNNRYADFGASDRVAFALNPSFDGTTLEIWAALLNGGCLVVVPQAVLLEPRRFATALRLHAVTVLGFTVGLLNQYVSLIGDAFASLRYLVVGGDAQDPVVVADLLAHNPPAHLINGYGPTETTTFATAYEIREVAAGAHSIPIGRPIANTQVYILDANRAPVPVGVVGEVYIGGDGLARGYLNDPRQTAERFVCDPWGSQPGARLYRTGDLGRWLPDGSIDCLGRNDSQVKVRGYRIELKEIETRLREHDAVRDAVVVARRDHDREEKRLIAYYTCRDDGGAHREGVDPEVLQRHVAATLPHYMVPSAYVRVPAFALTTLGKVDRQRLPDPDDTSYVAGPYEAPVGDLEIAVAKIWMRVLNVPRVGRFDNFFELGGDSLRAINVVKLLERMHIDIAAVNVFLHPTIASIVEHVIAQSASVRSNAAICVRAGRTERPLFLTPAGGGLLLYLADLAPHIDGDIPLYGLPPVPDTEAPYRTVEAMAARMVRMMRAVQPAGPYRVAGWSLGGIMAYEIATQLIGEDEDVEFVGLFDTNFEGSGSEPHPESRITPDDCQRLKDLIEHALVSGRKRLAPDADAHVALDELRRQAETTDLATFMTWCESRDLMPLQYAFLTPAQLAHTFARERSHYWCHYTYYPQPLPIPVSLFAGRASERSCVPAWAAVVAPERLHVIPVEGDHRSIVDGPEVRAFCQTLSHRVRETAGRVYDAPERRYSPLIPLQCGRPGTPALFCIPGAGSSVSSFVELIGAMNRSTPIYGFQPRGLDDDLVPHATVQAAAECYLQHLDDVYPVGPVHLMGHSFGGWVALQMAHLLIDTGREVGSLVIVDSEVPDAVGDTVREFDNAEAIMRWVDTFELVLGHSLGVAPEDIRWRPPAEQRRVLHARLVAEGLLPSGADPEVLGGPLRTFAAAIRTRYIPRRPYPGVARLVLVDDPRVDEGANRRNLWQVLNGWRSIIPALSSTHAQGNHMTVLKAPLVQQLATILEK